MGSGLLIKRAIEKQGIENFEKEILFIFDSKEEAEFKEAEIVNEEFVQRNDTYNIAIGGNVRAFPGKNNPMYGKSNPPEIISKMQETRKKTISDRGYFRKTKYECSVNGVLYYSASQAKIATKTTSDKRLIIFCGNPDNDAYFIDKEFQKEAELRFIESVRRKEEMSKLNSERAKKRFSGVMKTEEQRAKISAASAGKRRPWVADKINRNPEKIRKTAESHTGMKRTEEAKENMRIAHIRKRENEKNTEEQ